MATATLTPLSAAIPVCLNLALTGCFLLLQLSQYVLLPLILLPTSAGWLWLLPVIALLNNSYWALTHEAIHGHLYPDRYWNNRLGRLLAIAYGAPFQLVRIGHLLHHKHNRTLDRLEVFEPAEERRGWVALRYYATILGGLYLSELLSNLLIWLPRRWLAGLGQRLAGPIGGRLVETLLKPQYLREARQDSLAVLVLLTTAAFCYGAAWPWLLAILAARGLAISFLDNVYHYATPVGVTGYAADLRLPAPLSAWLLHFNYHGVHHRQPALPWRALPAVFAEGQGNFSGDFGRAALRQLQGPIAVDRLPVLTAEMP